MAEYVLRFMLDYGSGTCLWSGNDKALQKYDYAVMPSALPLSDEFRAELEKYIKWYDESLNWNDPGGDSLWSDDMWKHFNEVTDEMYHRICEELGENYEVEFIR